MFLKDVEEFVLVVGVLHVDEVDQDDSGEVSQADLAGDFCGGFQVDLAVGFFGFFPAGVFAAVYVYGDEGFGLLDDQEASAFEPDFFTADFVDCGFQAV